MTRAAPPLCVRWTIGDVSDEGFEALRLATWGAVRLFGPDTDYVVCVNSVPLARARARLGGIPEEVRLLDATGLLDPVIRRHVAPNMAEGVGWKFAPMRIHPARRELHLDNDCILWNLPEAIERWLAGDGDRCVIAEDVTTMLGQFEPLCGPEPRNSGIRGIPAGFDLAREFAEILDRTGIILASELDEQGLVTCACSRRRAPLVVSVDEVAICGPFPPHRQEPGRCGAHFVGLNARSLPWEYLGRSGEEWVRENWERMKGEIEERVEITVRSEE